MLKEKLHKTVDRQQLDQLQPLENMTSVSHG